MTSDPTPTPTQAPSSLPSPLLDRVPLALSGAALLGSIAIYNRLPAQVPAHMNLHGHIDGTLPKAVGAFLLPVIAAATWGVLRTVARRNDDAASAGGRAAIATVGVLVTTLLVFVHGLLMAVALSPNQSLEAGRPMAILFCVFWGIVALLLPRLPRNRVAGIRTPWTLTDDENWARTHRLGGQMAFAAAAFGLLASWFSMPAVAIGFVGASAVVPVVYSYWLSRSAAH